MSNSLIFQLNIYGSLDDPRMKLRYSVLGMYFLEKIKRLKKKKHKRKRANEQSN